MRRSYFIYYTFHELLRTCYKSLLTNICYLYFPQIVLPLLPVIYWSLIFLNNPSSISEKTNLIPQLSR